MGRATWWSVLWRGGVLTLVLTLVLALLQVLRLGGVLIESGPAALSLLWASVWAVPALVTVALPAGMLVGALTVFREPTQQGRWLAARLSGESLWGTGRTLVGVGAGLSGLALVFGLWVGPWGLERLALRLEEVFVVDRLLARPGHPVALSGDLVVAAGEVRRTGEGLELGEVWLAHRPGEGGVVYGRGRELSYRAGQWVLRDGVVRTFGARAPEEGSDEGPVDVELQAGEVALKSPVGSEAGAGRGHLGRWLRYVPEGERLDAGALIERARREDGGAVRAIAKRVALGWAPLGLLLLAFPLSGPCRVEGDGQSSWGPVLLGLASFGGYFGLVRAGELLAAAGAPDVSPALLPILGLGLVVVVVWWRLWARW